MWKSHKWRQSRDFGFSEVRVEYVSVGEDDLVFSVKRYFDEKLSITRDGRLCGWTKIKTRKQASQKKPKMKLVSTSFMRFSHAIGVIKTCNFVCENEDNLCNKKKCNKIFNRMKFIKVKCRTFKLSCVHDSALVCRIFNWKCFESWTTHIVRQEKWWWYQISNPNDDGGD